MTGFSSCYCNDRQCDGNCSPPSTTPYVSEKKRRRLEAERRGLEAERALGNLLAVIHRDGGQHQAAVGTDQAVVDAHARWAELMAKVEVGNFPSCEVPIEVCSYDSLRGAAGWAGCVRPRDEARRDWILWIGMDGVPMLWKRDASGEMQPSSVVKGVSDE